MGNSWGEFVKLVCEQDITEACKIVQLTQAMLESGRGTSELFTSYQNPYGMKFRNVLVAVASPVDYGFAEYAQFKSISKAVEGYWLFLSRKTYEGWDKYENDEHTLLRHLMKCGYVGTDKEEQDFYIDKCFKLFPEARHLIRIFTDIKTNTVGIPTLKS
jgi:N-acetylmuramoyl-L-alanine amidase